MSKYLLSLAGGGAKGIISIVILHEIYKKTKIHPRNLFDIFIGTSTGGIIALLLNHPDKLTTFDIIEFYTKEKVNKIFKGNLFNLPLSSIKYDEKNINSVLKDTFKYYKLKDILKPTIVTTYNMNTMESLFINSAQDKYGDLNIWELARMTSSAPTYFKPYCKDNNAYIDGGLFANNPAIFGYVEAKKMFPDEDIIVVHLGTGTYEKKYTAKQTCGWNLLNWAAKIFEICNDGQNDTSNYAIQKILPEDKRFIFDIELSEDLNKMDNIKNINKLFDATLEYINKKETQEKLNRLCSILLNKDI